MASKAVYARLKFEVYTRLVGHSEKSGLSVSSAVEDLIQKGLESASLQATLEDRGQEVTRLREQYQASEKEKAELKGLKEAAEAHLDACKTKEAVALSAQEHARELERQIAAQNKQFEQLRSYLLTPVGVCRKCHTELRLFDVGQMKCRTCGKWAFQWLPEREPPKTGWELARDGAAMVGTATVVVALLNALGGSGKGGGKT